MSATFLVVPQWQGSGSSRALRLIDGAQIIRGDLPAAATHTVDVPMEAGESLETGIRRYSSLSSIRTKVTGELDLLAGPVITIGGDCAADLASIMHAVAHRAPGDIALVWLDAHPDANDSSSSPSGAFHGMVLRALLGDAPSGLAPSEQERLRPDQVVLAGTRAVDDGEQRYIEDSGLRLITVDQLATPDAVISAIQATGASAVYLHIDLDVLDPAAMTGIGYPEPFGLEPELLYALIRGIRSRFELAGAGVMEFAPESTDAATGDLGTILRIIGALTGPLEGARR